MSSKPMLFTVEDILIDYATEIHASKIGSYDLRVEVYAPVYAEKLCKLLEFCPNCITKIVSEDD